MKGFPTIISTNFACEIDLEDFTWVTIFILLAESNLTLARVDVSVLWANKHAAIGIGRLFLLFFRR